MQRLRVTKFHQEDDMYHFLARTPLFRVALSLIACCLLFGLVALQISQTGTARASGETVSVWLTTPDQANLLSPQPALTFGSVGSNSTTIAINDTQTYQQMVGFGASLTDSSAWLIYNKMSQSQRNQLMTNLFSPTSGIGLDFLRQPMGSSDMALPAGYEGTNAPGEYTYDDMPAGQTDPNLSHFSISHDLAYIIPLLQQALQLNPNLKIMATPWTAPAWMKSNDSLQQGSLLTSDFQVYAQYFVDFIKAYQAQGVPIYAVTPQNEPENDNVMPTMPISASDETNFIANNLGPTFAQNGITTQILGYDHNWDDTSYPTTILSNSTAASYTSGIAWHCYAGNASAMSTLHNSFPNKATYETECSGGTWEGSNWPNGFQNTMELGINSARNWSRTVVRWNLALDPNGNPNLGTANSCTTCRGVVTIDQSTGNVTYNSDYYALGHFSKFVEPGAYAVASNSFGSGNIEDAAFKNPDGSDVLVVYNGGGSNTFQVEWNNEAFSYTLPAGAAVTFKWTANGSAPTPTPTSVPGSGYYYIQNLHSGLVLDDTNGSTSNGTLVQQWAESSGDANQEWIFVSAGGGYYYIMNLHSGLALDDTNGSTSNGTQVQLWAQYNGDTNQEWNFVSAGGGYYYIMNLHSGLALDDTNGSTSNGTIMQLWTQYNGNANQEWRLVAV
ncbi:MAG TPA: RICIN domain-containing protein [Ktedonobacteraceae bacterium]|nr:RICIN domain-containing protein [Ktedonobacteraceae bacterium]